MLGPDDQWRWCGQCDVLAIPCLHQKYPNSDVSLLILSCTGGGCSEEENAECRQRFQVAIELGNLPVDKAPQWYRDLKARLTKTTEDN